MQRHTTTENLICEKLIEMMENRPFYNIKVTDLVKYAGISRSTFYAYFDSIYSVLQNIEDVFISGLVEANKINMADFRGSNLNNAPDPLVLSSIEYLKNNLRLFRVLSGYNGDPSFQAKMATRIRTFIDNLWPSSDIPFTTKKMLICEYMSGGQWNICKWWAFHEDEIEPYDLAVLGRNILSKVTSLL